MKLPLISCLLWATVYGAPQTVKNYAGYKLVEVTPTSLDHVHSLHLLEEQDGIDFWTHPHKNYGTSFLLSPAVYKDVSKRLENMGMPVTIKNNNIQDVMNMEKMGNERARARLQTRSTVSIVNTFPRHSDLNTWLEDKAANNPEIAKVINIGQTYEGRDMKVLKVGKPNGTKPAIWLDAGIHAREWLTVATVVYMTERLVDDYYTNDAVNSLVNTFDWYILPSANPDGYEFTHTSDRLWRKTRTRGSWCRGADPNRNFDYYWMASGTSSSSCSDTYGGASAFSEPCTQNLRDAINGIKSQLKLYLSLHSYSQLWLTPWAYADIKPADYVELERVARIGARALQNVNGRSFEIGNPPSILYAASGGSYDWAKGVAGVKYSYVLELYPGRGSSNGFVVSESDIEKSGKEIWAATMAIANAIFDHITNVE